MLRVFASAKTLHQLSPPSQSLEFRLLLAFSLVEVVLQISPVFSGYYCSFNFTHAIQFLHRVTYSF